MSVGSGVWQKFSWADVDSVWHCSLCPRKCVKNAVLLFISSTTVSIICSRPYSAARLKMELADFTRILRIRCAMRFPVWGRSPYLLPIWGQSPYEKVGRLQLAALPTPAGRLAFAV